MPAKSSSTTAAVPAAGEAYRLGRWFAGVRRQGLLATLAPEAWHTLSALLSFTGRDGSRPFSLEQLALSLGLTRAEAATRLDQLATTRWQEQDLVRIEHSPAGEVVGARLAPLDWLEEVAVPAAPGEPSAPTPALHPAQNPLFPPSDLNGLARQLEEAGLSPAQVRRLVERYAPERLQRQLEWLPARGARNPAALLVRAIEGDWEAPREHQSGKETG